MYVLKKNQYVFNEQNPIVFLGSVFVSNHSPISGRSPQHVPSGGILASLTHRTRKRSHPHQLNANIPNFPVSLMLHKFLF